MIKIIHLITGLDQGGAETMLYNLLVHMDKARFENTVISMKDEGVFGKKIKALGIPVYCLHMRAGKLSLRNISQYRNLIRAIHPDIVQAWMYHANFFSVLARFFLPKHQIFFNIRTTVDGLQKAQKSTYFIVKMNAWLSRFADVVINNSRVSSAQHAKMGFSKDNNMYIGNGFDAARLHPSATIYTEFRAVRRYSCDTQIVAMFARYHPIKNHVRFLEMAKILNETYSNKIVYVMGGIGVDRENAELVAAIEALGLTNHVLLLGNVDVQHYLPAVNVVVLPSSREGFPNIIGEAMACGVPCVATDVGEIRNLLANKGYTVPVNDINALANSVIKLLSLPHSAYQSLSSQCAEHIRKFHSIQFVARQYEKIYSQVSV